MVADRAVRNVPEANRRADVRLTRYLGELKLTVNQLNAAHERNQQLRWSRKHAPTVRDLYALRELADMVYQSRDIALAKRARQIGVRFETDAPSLLKIRLAPRSYRERLDVLIEELSRVKVINDDVYHMIQLAVNQGVPASRAAARKLKQMQAERGQRTHPAFAALFKVIGAVGDKEQAPVVAHFLKDRDGWVIYYADQVCGDLLHGRPNYYRITY
uniref:Uncharacterized protein n=1 Tax=uncultured Armatimonadetes bacterium TaxID=157466 RepID=A0A6J4HHU1_9BACT|nr:hypothetical protein AVDCRST_MAG63-657 [uncultured Armatimonadetes bacterium]